MKAIDALKRLERAGAEHSRATEKLGRAANTMVAFIAQQCPRDLLLPRNYMLRWAGDEHCEDGTRWNKYVVRLQRNVRKELNPYSDEPEYQGNSVGFSYGDEAQSYLPIASRQHLLAFSKDIATGLLDEIAEFLENRTTENDSAADALKK